MDTEIRVRVTRADISRAFDELDPIWDSVWGSAAGDLVARHCPMAQALMRLGYAAVEVEASDCVRIGQERYAAITESPIGEQLWRLIADFDASLDDDELSPEPDEFVLRLTKGVLHV
jgi:hypothetical protein